MALLDFKNIVLEVRRTFGRGYRSGVPFPAEVPIIMESSCRAQKSFPPTHQRKLSKGPTFIIVVSDHSLSALRTRCIKTRSTLTSESGFRRLPHHDG
jgi:hypothetical protein